jgi:hypothetical protein
VQTKLARWWTGPDNQEVGLEAATLQRVRNSSLVESIRADNSPGIKSATEAMDAGRAARPRGMVGERRLGGEAPAQAGVERRRVRMPA